MTQLQYDNIFDAITDDKAEAADLQFRADLLLVLNKMFEKKSFQQKDIMKALGIGQSRASELQHCKIDCFSSGKLLGFLAAFGVRLRLTIDVTSNEAITISCPAQKIPQGE
jgi:predicted XRE-type DNA-binding protein